jgi:DNA-binding transcriptional MerR regulator/methylmalonyl-CoA mutase cobalamin-binding subunit
MRAAGQFPIRAAARLTGLSVDTLRAWERRYRAVEPVRGDRGRAYTERDIERLKLLASLVADGHAIGAIADKSDTALRRLAPGRSGHSTAAPAATIDLATLFRAMQRYDLEAIDADLNRYAVLLPPAELIFGVVLPVLREAGVRWEQGTISPSHEHLASGIVRGVLGGLLRSLPRTAGAPRMIFATPSGERHELGLLCSAVLAASAGYSPAYLGPDLPAADIAQAARQAAAAVLVLSGTTRNIEYRELRALGRLPDRIAVWAGGTRADDLREAIGPRARVVATIEDLRGRLSNHAG